VATWSDEADEILGGDHVVMLVYATPASGAVLLPLNNFAGRNAGRDREAGTISALNTSVGAWHKLERIRRNPKVAIAYHTRAHSETTRPGYVLVQGRASLSEPVSGYPTTLGERWDRFEPWTPTDACDLEALAAHLRRASANRCRGRARRRLARPRRRWPSRRARSSHPPGERRAGLTAHWFAAGAIGQHQRKHTGWLTAGSGSDQVLYAPHTQSVHRFPASRTVYRLASGAAARLGAREARRAGFLMDG